MMIPNLYIKKGLEITWNHHFHPLKEMVVWSSRYRYPPNKAPLLKRTYFGAIFPPNNCCPFSVSVHQFFKSVSMSHFFLETNHQPTKKTYKPKIHDHLTQVLVYIRLMKCKKHGVTHGKDGCYPTWFAEKKGIALPETNSSPLKIGHPKMKLVFQPSIFRCYVSFREGILSNYYMGFI